MWVQVSFVFIQTTSGAYTYARTRGDTAGARTCTRARARDRVAMRTRVSPVYVRVKYYLLLLLIVSTSFIRVEREETNVGIFPSPSLLLLSLSEHTHTRAYLSAGIQKCPTIVAAPTKGDYHRSFLQRRRLFRFARTMYQRRDVDRSLHVSPLSSPLIHSNRSLLLSPSLLLVVAVSNQPRFFFPPATNGCRQSVLLRAVERISSHSRLSGM